MLKIGDALPECTLFEYVDVPTDGCALGPNPVKLPEALAGKSVVIFGVPGAFTPTCSEQHLPGYLEAAPEFASHGIDQIWCVSVNDAFVMGAWGRQSSVSGRIRMLADGSADLARATGLTLDLSGKGLGLRSARFSMWVKDGVVKALNVESGGGLAVSDAPTLLKQIGTPG